MFMDRFSQKYLTHLSVSCCCGWWVPCCVEVPLVSHLPLNWAGFLRERQPISFGTKGHQWVKLWAVCLFQHTGHQKLCVAGYFNSAVCMLWITWKFNGDPHFTSALGRPLQFGLSQIRFSSFCIWCPDCLISLLDLSGLVCYLI